MANKPACYTFSPSGFVLYVICPALYDVLDSCETSPFKGYKGQFAHHFELLHRLEA